MDDQVKQLAQSLVRQGEVAQDNEGRMLVMEAAVCALVASHPDPEAFAHHLRRSWLQFGSQHSNAACDPHSLGGMAETLGHLEQASPVALKVRPPGTASGEDD